MGSLIETRVTTARAARGDGYANPQSSPCHGGDRAATNRQVAGCVPVETRRSADRGQAEWPGLDWSISLPGEATVVRVGRRLVRSALRDCPRRDDAELAVSELLTNAILHTASGVEGALVALGIQVGEGWARVEVADLGDDPWAEPETGDVHDEGGRGLAIVAIIADKTGHEPTPDGQSCWAEFLWNDTTEAGPAAPPRRPSWRAGPAGQGG